MADPRPAISRRWRVVFAALAIVAALLAGYQVRSPLAEGAQRHAGAVAATAGGVYLSLRSINAFLSTAQEVEVGASFVASGSAQPLKVLEPIDDTIERVAALVFTVLIVTGVLSVGMGPVATLGYALIALGAAVAAMRPRGATGQLGLRLTLYGGVLAVAVPGAFVASDSLSDVMTASIMAGHQAVLSDIMAEVAPGFEVTGDESGWWERMAGIGDEVERYTELAGNIYTRADELIASLVGMLSVFVFRLIVLPLLLLGGALVVARAVSSTLAAR